MMSLPVGTVPSYPLSQAYRAGSGFALNGYASTIKNLIIGFPRFSMML